ncbi:MAG: orotate phosphoribosyltransferase [Acidimicrobiia bacterium]|nr:orotate phosphoribosyltransferase [Acidimicrobiia bacterium]
MSGPPSQALAEHLREHALRTDGPFTLRSGRTSGWYLDARQTTFDGVGARLVGAAIAAVLPAGTTAVGGLTMGADPIALAAAMTQPALKAFSIRTAEKDHGTGGRIVGPVGRGDRAVVVEDTASTGAAMVEAVEVLTAAGIDVIGAVALLDRSEGTARHRLAEHGVGLTVLLTPADLGVGA